MAVLCTLGRTRVSTHTAATETATVGPTPGSVRRQGRGRGFCPLPPRARVCAVFYGVMLVGVLRMCYDPLVLAFTFLTHTLASLTHSLTLSLVHSLAHSLILPLSPVYMRITSLHAWPLLSPSLSLSLSLSLPLSLYLSPPISLLRCASLACFVIPRPDARDESCVCCR